MKTVLFTMVMFVALCFASCSDGSVKSSAAAVNDSDTVQVDSVDSVSADTITTDSVVK